MKKLLKMNILFVSLVLLFLCNALSVRAEGENEGNVELISDIKIQFTKGTLYRYRGIAIEPEVSSVTFTDENGVAQKRTEGFELKYYEDSNNIELGNANVWVSIDGYEGEVRIENAFSIVVSRPRNVNASAKKNQIVVKWDEVCGAHGYEVYRSTEKGTKGKLVDTISSGETTVYYDSSVQSGTTYYYTLRAFRKLGTECHYSEYTKQLARRAKLAATEITSAKRATYNTINLKWEKVKNADGYRIYRSTSANGEYKRVKTVKSGDELEYRDTVPTCGRKYYYKVAAYEVINDEKQSGNYSEAVWARTKPAKIQIKTTSVSKSQSVTLKWKKSSGATGYEIYRSTKKNSGYELVKTVKDADTLKWTNKKLDDEIVYYYKIRPYTAVSGEKVYGLYSDAFEKILIPKEIEEITEYTYVSYKSGGNTPKGWDCSGFTQWVYKNIYGISIPRSSREQAKIGTSISKNDMSKWKPGDILVYACGGSVNHVALYLGNGKIMHALNSTHDTVIQDVEYYESWDSRNNLKSVRRCL